MRCGHLLLMFSIAMISVSAQSRNIIENWNSDILMGQKQVHTLILKSAKMASHELEKSRQCQGKLISTFLDPSSLVQRKGFESFVVRYQLSYNQAQCRNSLLVTCSIKIESHGKVIGISNHQCNSHPIYEGGSSAGGFLGSVGNPDSQDDFGSDVFDDGENEPVRGGTDVERPSDGW